MGAPYIYDISHLRVNEVWGYLHLGSMQFEFWLVQLSVQVFCGGCQSHQASTSNAPSSKS
jgi:hypothetical protein